MVTAKMINVLEMLLQVNVLYVCKVKLFQCYRLGLGGDLESIDSLEEAIKKGESHNNAQKIKK